MKRKQIKSKNTPQKQILKAAQARNATMMPSPKVITDPKHKANKSACRGKVQY